MKQRHRFRLLAVAVLCAVPLTALAQTVRPAGRPSHVPIQGGISPALAEEFLNGRMQDAKTAAQMERLLNDLAEHPEKLGITEDKDQKALKKALEKAGGQPEKLLQDPAIKKIIGEAAARQEQNRHLTTEDRERIKDLAQLLPPSQPDPSDPGQPGQPPGKGPGGPQPAPITPGMPGGTQPPTPPVPPPPQPGALAPPPSPPVPPAKSPVNDRLRDLAETLADSPTFRRMMTNLGRVKAPEAGLGTWGRRLEGFENRFANLGMHLPSFSWPKGDFSPRGPRGRMIPASATPIGDAGAGGPLLLVLLAVGGAGLLAWGLLRRRGLVTPRRAGDGWRLGPWPVRPEAVHTRDELVRAFEHLALLLLGPAARSRNHHEIAAGMGEVDAGRRGAAERLAGLYEQARYAPPDEALPHADLAAARADLCLLAGVAAA